MREEDNKSGRKRASDDDMSEMRIMYTNAQRVRVAVIKPDLIVIVEAWTNGDISNEFLK